MQWNVQEELAVLWHLRVVELIGSSRAACSQTVAWCTLAPVRMPLWCQPVRVVSACLTFDKRL